MNNKIEKLIKQFAKLPRVGGRAAQRIVLSLLQDKTGKVAALSAALEDAAENIKPCSVCGCLTDKFPSCGGVGAARGGLANYEKETENKNCSESQTWLNHPADCEASALSFSRRREPPQEGNLCEFCRDSSRANGQLCLVRDLGDVWTLEKSGVFRGRYHIIGGLLSGGAGITPEDLNIANLPARIRDENITEIIFALPNTVEGKTTQHYIMAGLTTDDRRLVFTELASGVPLGGDLDYIDDGTLSIAFGGRKQI